MLKGAQPVKGAKGGRAAAAAWVEDLAAFAAAVAGVADREEVVVAPSASCAGWRVVGVAGCSS